VSDWQQIVEQISQVTGKTFLPNKPKMLMGGCINTASQLTDGKTHFFVKTNSIDQLPMFEAELKGLNLLHAAQEIRVARPLCTGVTDSQSYIVMEYIALAGGNHLSQELAGRQLAALHRVKHELFGWNMNNTIGSTPQLNHQDKDWSSFWAEQRLGYQLKLAANKSYTGQLQNLGEKLLASFSTLMTHDPQPSLIHGDLWSGNLGFDEQGHPVIYDPAIYFADREAEIAMTEMFGGFSADFYAAYNEAWPLAEGYNVRKKLYNLYHYLNHLNLFGGGYLGQSVSLMEQLLAEIE